MTNPIRHFTMPGIIAMYTYEADELAEINADREADDLPPIDEAQLLIEAQNLADSIGAALEITNDQLDSMWEKEDLIGWVLPDKWAGLIERDDWILRDLQKALVLVAQRFAEGSMMASNAECLLADYVISLIRDDLENGDELVIARTPLPEGWKSDLLQAFFDDLDHRWLFDPKEDGIEDSDIGQMLGVASLSYADLFETWYDIPTNPLLQNRSQSSTTD